MTRRPNDAGLYAVVRIREVRERDTRLEVADAQQARARAIEVVVDLRRALEAPVPVESSTAGFTGTRAALLGLAESITRARAEVAAAEARTADALARWQAASSQLSAVEGLLERRAEARRAETRRAEARELDDIAGRLREAARRRAHLERSTA